MSATATDRSDLTREELLELYVWLDALSLVGRTFVEHSDRYGVSPAASLLPEKRSRRFEIRLSDAFSL